MILLFHFYFPGCFFYSVSFSTSEMFLSVFLFFSFIFQSRLMSETGNPLLLCSDPSSVFSQTCFRGLRIIFLPLASFEGKEHGNASLKKCFYFYFPVQVNVWSSPPLLLCSDASSVFSQTCFLGLSWIMFLPLSCY